MTVDALQNLVLTTQNGPVIAQSSGSLELSSTQDMSLTSQGGLNINATGGPIHLGSGAGAQPINIGAGDAAKTVTIGNTQATINMVGLQSSLIEVNGANAIEATAIFQEPGVFGSLRR